MKLGGSQNSGKSFERLQIFWGICKDLLRILQQQEQQQQFGKFGSSRLIELEGMVPYL